MTRRLVRAQRLHILYDALSSLILLHEYCMPYEIDQIIYTLR